jgi:glutamate/tyrosine decarboxylase-like PLP-dependent enzyme
MEPRDVRLAGELAERLGRRAAALARLGSLATESVELEPAQAAALAALAERLANTYPYGDPHYVGQMLKPPHPLAWAAYATAMLLNPNNHALDGGPATAEMEKEAIAAIAAMFGYREHIGHLTSSGTIANLEALWVARELHPDRAIVFGENAHYTHARMCHLIGAPADQIAQDEHGRMDTSALEQRLRAGRRRNGRRDARHDQPWRTRPARGDRRALLAPWGPRARRRGLRRVLRGARRRS